MVTKLAVSDDGLTWARPHHDYLLKPEMPWEGGYNLAKAAVVRDDEVWLYYFGKKGKTEMVALARLEGSCAFPDCVIKEGGTRYLYYNGWTSPPSRSPAT